MKERLGTLNEFLELIKKPSPTRLYRGVRSARFPLIPSVGRDHYGFQPTAELERLAIAQFKIKAAMFTKGLQSEIDYLVLARHYGLRTRFLDWTANPYIALYFALLDFDATECYPPCIYIVTSPELKSYFDITEDPLDEPGVVFFQPPHLDPRIGLQQAYLSIHQDPFNSYDADNIERFSIIPTPGAVEEIENTLLKIGILQGTIYPGLDGICKDINDNPGLLVETLRIRRVAASNWQPVPYSWACRPWPETRQFLIEQRRLSEFLAFKHDASIVGIGIEKGDQRFGVLFGYDPGVALRVFDSESKLINTFELADGAVDGLMVEKVLIEQYFPNNDVTFRTKRPRPSKESVLTPSALYGGEYWSNFQQPSKSLS